MAEGGAPVRLSKLAYRWDTDDSSRVKVVLLGANAADFLPALSPAAGHALTGCARGGGAALRAVSGRGVGATYEMGRGRVVLSGGHFQQPRGSLSGGGSGSASFAEAAAWGWGSADCPSADTVIGSLIPSTVFQCTVRPRKRLTLALASISRFVPGAGARAAPPAAGLSSNVSVPGLGWIRPLGDATPRRPMQAPQQGAPRSAVALAPQFEAAAAAGPSVEGGEGAAGAAGSTVLGLYATAAAGALRHGRASRGARRAASPCAIVV